MRKYSWAYADLDLNVVIDVRGISGMTDADFKKEEFESIVKERVCKMLNSRNRFVSESEVQIYYSENSAMVVVKIETSNEDVLRDE